MTIYAHTSLDEKRQALGKLGDADPARTATEARRLPSNAPGRRDPPGRFGWSEVAVRGGVEPPTFRFSGGFASPYESTTGGLTRPYGMLTVLGVQDQLHVSTAVVSKALARSELSLWSTTHWPVATTPTRKLSRRPKLESHHRIKSLSGGVHRGSQPFAPQFRPLARTPLNWGEPQ